MKHIHVIQGGMLAAATALLLSGLTSASCGKAEETFDNIDSRVTCREYCDKTADCNDEQPSDDETKTCVSACRDSLEDECGNDHQAAANDKIAECIDMECTEFWDCMVFDPEPACLGFVDGH